jgi:hypothetical protein
MMDSQENVLEQGKNEEEKSTPIATPQVDNVVETTPAEVEKKDEAEVEDLAHKIFKNKKDVLERVREIVENDEIPQKDELDHLKTSFYKLHIAERDADMKAYLDNGGEPENYSILPDQDEEAFKAEMQVIKDKRAHLHEQMEKEKQANYEKELEIIEKIKNMATSPDEANKSYNDFKQLQQEWKNIKAVPAEKSNELWRNYQLYVEQFYDLLNLNREAREYDFKKNLEIKTALCEKAEKLAEETDVISAFHQLQELHQEFRETGPVEKDLRDSIWARFKAASTVINKEHQQHFEDLRKQEEDNLAKKTTLCEKVESIAKEDYAKSSEWEKQTEDIKGIQAEWKTIGFAPQKMNVKIFERFRAACDEFFGKKAEFFKVLKEKYTENIEKKKALVEEAKSLTDSTDWKETSKKLIELQKEWKTIGMVPKKISDHLWEDFTTACNHFFEARKTVNNGAHTEEHANLSKKKEIINKLKELSENAGEDIQNEVQKLIDEYNAVGHVPYKDKDKIYEAYHDVLDKLYKDLHISIAKRRLDIFKNNLQNVAKSGGEALDNERSRLMRRYEGLKQEINTYENNLGFLNVSSKKGNTLIEEMNRKVEKLKDDLKLVKEKIKAIDAKNKENE